MLIERYSHGDSDFGHDDDWEDVDCTAQVAALEDLLATKLAEYLNSTYQYSLSKLPSTALALLYKGPPKSGLYAVCLCMCVCTGFFKHEIFKESVREGRTLMHKVRRVFSTCMDCYFHPPTYFVILYSGESK